jgi:nucleoside-diphosphate-sugar epimerase
MRIFLAGASGVLGRELTPLLLQAGHQVTGMSRSSERAAQIRAQGADAVVCDAFDPGALNAVVVAARPAAVIHQLTDLPQQLDPRKYQTQLAGTNRLRREGTRNLLAAARAAGAEHFLAQSIAFAYAAEGDWVKDEEAALALDSAPPMSDAVQAVAELERQVLGAEGIVLRYGFFYGPGTQFALGGFYAELARKRRFPLVGSGDGQWSFIHVEDAARATLAALERGAPGIYNVVDDDPAPARDWVPRYAAAIGARRPFRVPVWLGRLGGGAAAVSGMTTQRAASNAKAKRDLAWTPMHPSWRDGFGATAP